MDIRNRALSLCGIGLLSHDAGGTVTAMDSVAFAVLGLDALFESPARAIGEHIDGLMRIDEAECQSAAALDKCGPLRDFVCAVRMPEGEVRWLEVIAFPEVAASQAEPVRHLAVRDVTESVMRQRALRESEERYRSLVENMPSPLMRMDKEGRYVFLNKAQREHDVLRDTDIIGQKLESVRDRVHPDDYAHLLQVRTAVLEREESFVTEARMRQPGGDWRWFSQVVYPWYTPEGELGGVEVIAHDVTELKRAEARVRALSRRLLAAQETARVRLASDLHDGLAQDLGAIQVVCKTLLKETTDCPPAQRERLEQVTDSLLEAIGLVRSLAQALRPPSLNGRSLARVLAECCNDFERSRAFEVHFSAGSVEHPPVSEETGVNLYRIVQEALRNAVSHSGTREAWVALNHVPGELALTVRDEGVGFDVVQRRDEAANELRMGIQCMEERAAMIGGRLYVHSEPDKGTTVSVTVPVPPLD